jgi:hypothetical protein
LTRKPFHPIDHALDVILVAYQVQLSVVETVELAISRPISTIQGICLIFFGFPQRSQLPNWEATDYPGVQKICDSFKKSD